jgi:uncharacterized protein GlcG (DUF336 family)
MQVGIPRATLSTEAIETLLRAAAARARELEIRVHIAIMDSAADLVGFLTCEGAPRIAATTARQKAFTAVNTGMPTEQWKAYVESIPAEETKIIDRLEGYIAARGGLPVIEAGQVLGGIGVSGADQDRDEDVARSAVAALGLPDA